jgi:hypothetical protein
MWRTGCARPTAAPLQTAPGTRGGKGTAASRTRAARRVAPCARRDTRRTPHRGQAQQQPPRPRRPRPCRRHPPARVVGLSPPRAPGAVARPARLEGKLRRGLGRPHRRGRAQQRSPRPRRHGLGGPTGPSTAHRAFRLAGRSSSSSSKAVVARAAHTAALSLSRLERFHLEAAQPMRDLRFNTPDAPPRVPFSVGALAVRQPAGLCRTPAGLARAASPGWAERPLGPWSRPALQRRCEPSARPGRRPSAALTARR